MAEIKCSYDTARKRLCEIVPLKAPLSMYIEPTKKCNFKCFYCMHATRGEPDGIFQSTGYECKDMASELFEKIVAEVLSFEEPPKRICFSGLGEPLMNPNLPQMVSLLRSSGYNGRIDIITNGSLLTHDLAKDLVSAGVSRFQISIQGLSSKDYKENCGVEIAFNKFLDNIQFLFDNRQKSSIYIKIIDSMLHTEADRETFFRLFSPMADQIFVEHLIVMEQQMGNHGNQVDPSRNLNNEPYVLRDVCPVSFYHLQITQEGLTFPCPVPGLPQVFSMGNVNEMPISSIWDGKKRTDFLKLQLKKQRYSLSPCGTCVACAAVMDENENLDHAAEQILEKLS